MAKGRSIPPVTLTTAERETLVRWARRPTTAKALAVRACMVLASAAGKPILHVAREEDVSWATARQWRRRFCDVDSTDCSTDSTRCPSQHPRTRGHHRALSRGHEWNRYAVCGPKPL